MKNTITQILESEVSNLGILSSPLPVEKIKVRVNSVLNSSNGKTLTADKKDFSGTSFDDVESCGWIPAKPCKALGATIATLQHLVDTGIANPAQYSALERILEILEA